MAKTKKNVQKKRQQLRKKTRGRKIKCGGNPPGPSMTTQIAQRWAKKLGTGGVSYNVYYKYYNGYGYIPYGPYTAIFYMDPSFSSKEDVVKELYVIFAENDGNKHGLNADNFVFDDYTIYGNDIVVTLRNKKVGLLNLPGHIYVGHK